MAGPPGAGKSSALRDVLAIDEASRTVHPGNPRVIDPDAIKDALLRASLDDGSYHQWLMPEQVWKLHQSGDRFHARELATLVHQESSTTALNLLRAAIREGADLVYDSTMGNQSAALDLVTTLKRAGYHVTIAEVSCSLDQSLLRTFDRWLIGRRQAEDAELDERLGWSQRMGGRFVPPDFVRRSFDPGNPNSALSHGIAQEVFRQARADKLIGFRVHPGHAAPVVESIQTWSNGTARHEPVHAVRQFLALSAENTVKLPSPGRHSRSPWARQISPRRRHPGFGR